MEQVIAAFAADCHVRGTQNQPSRSERPHRAAPGVLRNVVFRRRKGSGRNMGGMLETGNRKFMEVLEKMGYLEVMAGKVFLKRLV